MSWRKTNHWIQRNFCPSRQAIPRIYMLMIRFPGFPICMLYCPSRKLVELLVLPLHSRSSLRQGVLNALSEIGLAAWWCSPLSPIPVRRGKVLRPRYRAIWSSGSQPNGSFIYSRFVLTIWGV